MVIGFIVIFFGIPMCFGVLVMIALYIKEKYDRKKYPQLYKHSSATYTPMSENEYLRAVAQTEGNHARMVEESWRKAQADLETLEARRATMDPAEYERQHSSLVAYVAERKQSFDAAMASYSRALKDAQ